MKLLVALCLCFVSFYHLGYAANEPIATQPENPTSSTLVSTSEINPTTVIDILTSEPAIASVTDVPTVTESSPPTPAAVDVENQTNVSETITDVPTVTSAVPAVTETPNVTNFIDNLSTQIRSIIQHFQSPEPIGFPGQTILPDPLPAPDRNENLGIGTGYFYGMTVHGLSNFKVKSVNTLLDHLEVYVEIEMKHIYIIGNCTLEALLLTTRGPFNITLENVTAEGTVFLVVEPDGTVRANKSVTNMSYEKLNFQYGVNATSSFFESLISGAGIAVITAIRPYILHSIDERLTDEVNKQLKDSPKFPKISARSPIDLAVIEARKYIASKYEPYTIVNILNYDSQYLTLSIGPVNVHGLSKFARVGDVTLGMANRTVIIKLRMITGSLRGGCNFDFNFGKIGPTRHGNAKFSIQHLQFEAIVKQSMNLTKKPILEDLQLETGVASVSLDGAGKFDYVVELLVQLLPTMLRHLIIDALEEPIRQKIQTDILNKINPEDLVENNLSLFESLLASKSK